MYADIAKKIIKISFWCGWWGKKHHSDFLPSQISFFVDIFFYFKLLLVNVNHHQNEENDDSFESCGAVACQGMPLK